MNTAGAYKILFDTLQDLVNVYSHLRDLIAREREILISAQISDLHESNRTKEKLILRLHELERERKAAAKNLGHQVGLNQEKPILSEICERMTAEEGQELKRLQDTLVLLIERVQEMNASNEALVDSALQNVTGAMGGLRDQMKKNPTYKKEGALEKGPVSSGRLVSKEA